MVTALAVALLAAAPTARAIEAPIAPDAAWCWFQDPRAVYDDSRTFTGYVTAAGDIGVASYDHRTNELRRFVIARGFQRDDHAAPALHVLSDGRVMGIWSAHRGRQMYLRVTKRPGDVFGWSDTRVIGSNAPGFDTYTYANPVRVGRSIYVFWRAETGSSAAGQAAYSVSEDGGETWAPGRVLLYNPGQRPYVKYDSRGDTIHVAYTEGHPNATQTGIRYAAFRNGRLYKADGSLLGDAPMSAIGGERVYGGAARAWVWDVAAGSEGRPVIVYATFPSRTDHRYRYARWNGSRWIDVELTRAGGSIATGSKEYEYSGGITLDHGDPSTVYLSRRVAGVYEIERWRTPDRGRSWSSVAVTSGSLQNNVRPVAPRAAHSDEPAPVVWMRGSYPGYTNFSTGLWTSGLGSAPAEVPAPAPDPQTPPPGGGGSGSVPEGGEGDTSPAGAGGARQSGLRIKVSRAVVRPGQRVLITGTMFDQVTRGLLDGRSVGLYMRVSGTHRWVRTARVRTDARGDVHLK